MDGVTGRPATTRRPRRSPATPAGAKAIPEDPFRYPCLVDDSPFPWVGVRNPKVRSRGRRLVVCRDRVVVWGGAIDGSLVGDFHEMALVSLGGTFYVVTAAGGGRWTRQEVWRAGWSGPLADIVFAHEVSIELVLLYPAFARAPIEAALVLAASMTGLRRRT